MIRTSFPDIEIFNLTPDYSLGNKIIDELNKRAGKFHSHIFPNGEINVYPLEEIKGKTIYVIQSFENKIADKLIELLLFIDACKKARVAEINLILPYIPYTRQDHPTFKEPASFLVMMKALKEAGAQRIITLDIHSRDLINISPIEIVNIPSFGIFSCKIKALISKYDLIESDVVLYSCDNGGRRRNDDYLLAFPSFESGYLAKYRDDNGNVSSAGTVGDFKDKTLIIIDDIIDTGKTLELAIRNAQKEGARNIYVFATHGIFSSSFEDRLQRLDCDRIWISDTFSKTYDKMDVISAAPVIAKVVKKLEKRKIISVFESNPLLYCFPS